MDVIKEIQGTFHPRGRGSDSAPQLSNIMPLQEGPMDTAIDRVVENVGTCLSWQEDRQVAKSQSSFLVCSGTAGTGKGTHFCRITWQNLITNILTTQH